MRFLRATRIIAATLVLLLLPEVTSGVECQPENESQYIADLSDQQLRQDDPDAYAEAIQCLGKLESLAAVNSLISLIDYQRSFTTEKSFHEALSRMITRRVLYPAVRALADIGKPALPSLANVLARDEVGTESYESAFYVFLTIFRENREEGAAYLEMEAAGLQRTELERERLLIAAEKLAAE